MKKTVLTLIFLGLTFIVKSQDASVEKSTFGIQTGGLGIWAHHEAKLSNQIALRSEIGLDIGFLGGSIYSEILGGSFYPEKGYIMTPVIRLEPRWYYNLNKRVSKSRDISGNSGNFLTLQTSYSPNWFVITNHDNLKVADQISIIPTWGIKRNIGNHFTYETGIGVGYRYIFAKSIGYSENKGEAALNLHLRIGYRF